MGEAGKDTPTRYELLAVAAGDLLPTTLATGRVVAQLALQATTGPVDARTMNERILDAVLATLEKTASKEQQRYVVDGRELERWPLAELERLASRYRSLVAQEAALAQGVLPFTVYKVGLA
jgi:hypothetical protein